MNIPKFLLADNSQHPDSLYVIHTDFPRFILNIENDDIEWLEDFDEEDQKVLEEEAESLIQQAFDFYDQEIKNYED